MQRVNLQKQKTSITVGTKVVEEGTEDWTIIRPGTAVYVEDKLELIYAPLAMGPSAGFHVETLVREVQYSSNVRLAKEAEAKEVGGRKGRIVTTDLQFGFRPQRPVYGHPAGPCKFNHTYPLHYDALVKMAGWLEEQYELLNPAKFDHHQDQMKAVREDSRIGETVFTQGVINKANILPYHFDRGNFPGTWSAMVYFVKNVSGGQLLMPELKAKLIVEDRTYVLFDGQGTLHGVSPAHGTRPLSYRYSLVFYALALMKHVGTQEEQMQKIRHSDMVKHKKVIEKL